MPDHVTCTKCSGTGRAPLEDELQRTLDVCRTLAQMGRGITAIAVAAKLDAPVGPTVINNRLNALVALGLIRRRPRRVRRRVAYEMVEEVDVA